MSDQTNMLSGDECNCSEHDKPVNQETMEFTDRYQLLGLPRPKHETMCQGQCEGTGIYPHQLDSYGETIEERIAWFQLHFQAGVHVCDKYHFITCPTCHGTGLRNEHV